jgi:gliding motility-associated lipoprotein GldH
MLIDQPGEYDVSLVVKHDASYAYSNLNLDISYSSSDGESRTRPHTLNLMNENGVFSGVKSKDGFYEFTYEAFNALSIQKEGTVSFEIDNVMPVFDLKGIYEVGLSVRKHKKSN